MKTNPRLKTLDDLFAGNVAQQPQPVENISLPENATMLHLLTPDIIRPFHKHPFRLYDGKRLDDLVESITTNGILTPVIIRMSLCKPNFHAEAKSVSISTSAKVRVSDRRGATKRPPPLPKFGFTSVYFFGGSRGGNLCFQGFLASSVT